MTGLPDGSGDRATLRVHEENPHNTVGPPNLGTRGVLVASRLYSWQAKSPMRCPHATFR